MSPLAAGETCPHCQCTVDPTKPGWGHRKDATMFCGEYTFTVPDDVKTFLREAPKDATPSQLLDGWLSTKFGIDRKGNKI